MRALEGNFLSQLRDSPPIYSLSASWFSALYKAIEAHLSLSPIKLFIRGRIVIRSYTSSGCPGTHYMIQADNPSASASLWDSFCVSHLCWLSYEDLKDKQHLYLVEAGMSDIA